MPWKQQRSLVYTNVRAIFHTLPIHLNAFSQRQLRQDAARKQLAAKIAKVKAGGAGGAGDSGEYGISWGFDEDAVAEESDEEGEEEADGEGGEVRPILAWLRLPMCARLWMCVVSYCSLFPPLALVLCAGISVAQSCLSVCTR